MASPALGRRRGTRASAKSASQTRMLVAVVVSVITMVLLLAGMLGVNVLSASNPSNATVGIHNLVHDRLRGHHFHSEPKEPHVKQVEVPEGVHFDDLQADDKPADDDDAEGDADEKNKVFGNNEMLVKAAGDDDNEESQKIKAKSDDDDAENGENEVHEEHHEPPKNDDDEDSEKVDEHEEHHEPPKLQAEKKPLIAVSPDGDKQPYPHMGERVPETFSFTDWKAPGGNRFEEYKAGDSPYLLTDDIKKKSDELARTRRVHVKNAMKHAWGGYTKYAFGMDEVSPRSHRGSNGWGGMGTTLVDSLDTLWLMGMKDEFDKARDWVRDQLHHDLDRPVSVFETTIRSLGGLLSAYDWSGDKAFLEKAQDLGERLIKAFDSPSGIPYGQVNLQSGSLSNIGWAGNNAILAEFGTMQIEFRYLAKATNTPEFATKTEHVFDLLREVSPDNGLFPYYVRNGRKKLEFANNKLTFGAMADSIYEYMLKIWLQGGRMESKYREMYDKAIQGMHDELLQTSTPSGLTYIADKSGDHLDHKMDHLVCFMGGLLALGAYTDPKGLESERAQRDLKTGKALTYTCYQMYARMATGISPEWIQFYPDHDFEVGRGSPHYLLRPEAVESMFILNYLTGDPIYREWGWEVFSAIERYCKTQYAYAELRNVQDPSGPQGDKMESFFLAETLKYLYLLHDPDTEVDILNKHVFNTEAHPLRIFPVIDKATK